MLEKIPIIVLSMAFALGITIVFTVSAGPTDDTLTSANPSSVERFETYYGKPSWGPYTVCVRVEEAGEMGVRLSYLPSVACDQRKVYDPAFDFLSTPHRHFYIVANPGRYYFNRQTFELGHLPTRSPGATTCLASGDTVTYLLDPRMGLGALPAEYRSDHKIVQVPARQLFYHETGHAAVCGSSSETSKATALRFENWSLLDVDPNSAVRFYHDLPVFGFFLFGGGQ